MADSKKKPATVTGSLVQQRSPQSSGAVPAIADQSSVPGEDEKKLQELLRLGSHFWTKDFTPAQAKAYLDDYIVSLGKYRAAEVEHACRDWREDPSRKDYPKISQLIQLLDQSRRDITEAAAARERPMTVSRPLMWWTRPKSRWNFGWLETEVPRGEKIRDEDGGELRYPQYR